MTRRSTLITVIVGALVLAGLGALVAQAELSASGNLFVTFNGGITPTALPRQGRAPVTVQFSGKVRTLSGQHPPPLRQIVLKLNRHGHLDLRGLSVCKQLEVASSTTKEALEKCGNALVGTGAYITRVSFPEQPSYASHGRILAFNSRVGGKPAILAHVYGKHPAPVAYTILFNISRPSGLYGTELRAQLPAALSRHGYLKRISLRFHRTYAFRGVTHSYLSADCPAPTGLRLASFNFAFASMSFADGRTLVATLTRTCEVAE